MRRGERCVLASAIDIGGESLTVTELRLLTVAEVAEATGFSRNAVYRAIAAGELRASKLRGRLRVQLADLDAWIESNVLPGPPHGEVLARPVHS